MDAADRCIQKCDELLATLREIRRYNHNTAIIVMILWGLGLPVVVFGSLIWAAWRL